MNIKKKKLLDLNTLFCLERKEKLEGKKTISSGTIQTVTLIFKIVIRVRGKTKVVFRLRISTSSLQYGADHNWIGPREIKPSPSLRVNSQGRRIFPL